VLELIFLFLLYLSSELILSVPFFVFTSELALLWDYKDQNLVEISYSLTFSSWRIQLMMI